MARRQIGLAGLICVASLVWANGAGAQAQTPGTAAPNKVDKAKIAAANVPLEAVPDRLRESVKIALDKPALYTQGPVETFACSPQFYYWLLEHPDRGVMAWRHLGAPCLMIAERGPGRFGWKDEHGSDLQWEAVYHSNDRRIWYAEGKVRPAPLLPLVSVKAVVVLRYSEVPGPNGTKLMQHQADMFFHTDNAGAALATKLFGAAAPKMAEQCVSQMQTFFAALAWYVNRYPDQAPALLAPGDAVTAPARAPFDH